MSSAQERLAAARDILAAWVNDFQEPEPERLDAGIAPADLMAAVRALQTAHWGYLAAITGLDLGAEAGQLEVLYHFCSGAAVMTLRVPIPRQESSVPSICEIIPSASVFERELAEMLGVTVIGTPNTDRLFLADDWPLDSYPLRKDAFVGSAEKEQGA
ncbi:MAG: NADH-quinone oxidoreductase subunit C [Chloroflexi bacterium]|nr:NADH-quinone oxidoreductase subunit C [Chloroflexota bacterium]MDL1884554.1 NADH-quinone oxidoreductase subunit C [Anaerolineae bacterium CFX8]